VFSDNFVEMLSKNNFLKIKKYYFDVFFNEKQFEKQPQPHSNTPKTLKGL
jgi:hypothetical protein